MKNDKLQESLMLILESEQLNNRDLMSMLQQAKQIITDLYGEQFILENDTWPNIRFKSIGRNKLGECQVETDTSYWPHKILTYIHISNILQDFSYDEVMNTVIHEYIHSLKCCFKCEHNGKWKEIADKVNNNTNYNIMEQAESVQTDKFKDIYDKNHKTVYHIICTHCNFEYKYYTSNAQIVKHPQWFKHKCKDRIFG